MRNQFLQSLRLSRIGRGGRAASSGDPIAYAPAPPSDGLIADWRFAEGSGMTVADETGTYEIDLTSAPTPNVSWESHGVTTASGAVETPSMTGVRTIVQLYRVPTDQTNKFLQAGPVAGNQGPYGRSVVSAEGNWLGQGFGVFPVFSRTDGQYAWPMTSGGWRLYIRELVADTDGIITFGSRTGSTSNRYTEMKMAWGAVYDRVLSDAERAEIYSFARGLSAGRGIYIDAADCPTQVDYLLLMGQSNADGRGYITDLSEGDQARSYSETKISLSTVGIGNKTFDSLVLGSNHSNADSTRFGAEIPIANAREDTTGSRPLYIRKSAKGGTYLAPSTDANVSAGSTWSTEEAVGATASFWLAVAGHYYVMADALDNGIGLDIRGLIWFQGEEDAQHTSTANVWEAQMNALISELDAHLGISDYPIQLARIYESSADDATAYATVRAAQAAVVTGLGARATLIDTDSMAHGDYVHLDADGLVDLANDVADQIW